MSIKSRAFNIVYRCQFRASPASPLSVLPRYQAPTISLISRSLSDQPLHRKQKMTSHFESGPIRTTYTSKPVTIPENFLTATPVQPVSLRTIDFANSPIPERDGSTAVVFDNVLSYDECQQLLELAESSVPSVEGSASAWRPALVNIGGGMEMANTSYRNSDRIIWDQQTIVDRIWDRCLQAEGAKEIFSRTPDAALDPTGNWQFSRVNNRMRFLKYTSGQFFQPHCDGCYYYQEGDTEYQTHYTIQLYLSDSVTESSTGEGHVGGATSFLSRDRKRRLDVNPKMGSLLVFQHEGLLHEGQMLQSGTKYTMRSDILYRWQPLE